MNEERKLMRKYGDYFVPVAMLPQALSWLFSNGGLERARRWREMEWRKIIVNEVRSGRMEVYCEDADGLDALLDISEGGADEKIALCKIEIGEFINSMKHIVFEMSKINFEFEKIKEMVEIINNPSRLEIVEGNDYSNFSFADKRHYLVSGEWKFPRMYDAQKGINFNKGELLCH